MAKKIRIYSYNKCSTCRKALKWLDAKGVSYDVADITETPPKKTELKQMLEHYEGDLKRLFNTSGQVYRAMKLSSKLPDMSKAEAIDLLASDGKLVKRPFTLGGDFGLVGFKEDEWKAQF